MTGSANEGTWSFDTLPPQWTWAEFGDVWSDQTSSRRKLAKKNYLVEGDIPVIDQGEAFVGGYSNNNALISNSPLPAIVWGDHTKCIKYVTRSFIQGADGVKVLAPTSLVVPRFSYFLLQTINLPDKGYSRHFKFLKDSKFPLPPFPEQRRLTDRLEAALAIVNRVTEQLADITLLSAGQRRSLLSMSFDGVLTEKWRLKRGETARQLVPISTLCNSITDGDHQAPPQSNSGVPFITISAINDGKLNLGKAKRFVPAKYYSSLQSNRRAMRNDILYSVTGSIGFVAIVDTDAKFVFQRHIALIRPDLTKVRPRFLQYMISAPQILSQAQSKSTGIAQKTLSLSALRQFEVPIFSLAEQDEIIVQLERGFAWLETTVSEAARVSTLVSHLERSLLVKGLSGQLVSQHADDEPAVDALVRFRAEGHLSRQQQKGRPKMVVRPAHERSGKSGGLIMAKTRSDVKKDYLKALLLNMGGAGGPKELLQRSEMDVDEFYKQLRDEVKAGRIRESARKDKLVATNAT